MYIYQHLFYLILSGSLQGRVQFFVWSQADSNFVNVLMNTISLSPGETLHNISLPGLLRTNLSLPDILSLHIMPDVIFTVSFSLDCEEHYYGPNCTVYCRPSDSDELGDYSCLSNGSIQCLQDYQNEDTNCTECAVAEGCDKLLPSSSSSSMSPAPTPLPPIQQKCELWIL